VTLPIDTTADQNGHQPENRRDAAWQLCDALHRHYCDPGREFPGGAFLREVQLPGHGTRRADAVYLGFTAAGRTIDVCEIKVHRSDFMAEVADTGKAEPWFVRCHRFWIVAPHESVAPVEHLPPGWGLMVPKARGRQFRVVRAPDVREPIVDLSLLMEIAKKLDTMRVEQARAAREQERWKARQRSEEDRVHAGRAGLSERDRTRLDVITDVERRAGVDFDRDFWEHEDRVAALRAVVDVQRTRQDTRYFLRSVKSQSASLARQARQLADQAAEAERKIHEPAAVEEEAS